MNPDEWWSTSSLDFAWWQVWFERYRNFIFSFADKAQLDGADGMVIGGEWIAPSLPGGKLPDGSPSGVPADAQQRWRDIITGVRERFDGTLFWGLPAGGERINPPPFGLQQESVPLSFYPGSAMGPRYILKVYWRQSSQ